MNKINQLTQGVMFNAYPDSIGRRLADSVDMLKRPEFEGVFSLFLYLCRRFSTAIWTADFPSLITIP